MIEFVKRLLGEQPTVKMDCFYGATFPKDEALLAAQSKTIALQKKQMGDKYLLAKKVEVVR